MKQDVNRKVRLNITDITQEGKGVGRLEGKVVFVEGALPGEDVLAEICSVKKSYLEAKTIALITESPHRIDVKCEINKDCGGCQLQNLQYEEQLRVKKRIVDDALRRIGGIEGYDLHDTIGMEYPWGYRNKVMFQVGKVKGKMRLGFFKPKSHILVPFTDCILLDEDMQRTANEIEKLLKDTHRIMRVLIRKSKASGEILVGFVTAKKAPLLNDMADTLYKKNRSLSVVQNYTAIGKPWGKETVLLAGKEYITERINGLIYRISADSFFQINSLQTKSLYDKVVEFAQINKEQTVWDVYCGIGTISLYVAKKAKYVYGIESVRKAVRDAWKNAEINGIENVEFIKGPAEVQMPKLIDRGVIPNIIILDPPRRGCHGDVLHSIVAAKPERVVYVSCNPATLARDLRALVGGGYNVREVQPVDMFPHTGHVETVVLIKRKHS